MGGKVLAVAPTQLGPWEKIRGPGRVVP